MKKLILAIFLIYPSVAYCQSDVDSLKNELLKLKTDKQSVDVSLYKATVRSDWGILLSAAGILFVSLDLFILSKERDINGKPYKNDGRYIGLGMITAGTVIQINSNKHIRRAKRRNNY